MSILDLASLGKMKQVRVVIRDERGLKFHRRFAQLPNARPETSG
jgi:hypothetical protein